MLVLLVPVPFNNFPGMRLAERSRTKEMNVNMNIIINLLFLKGSRGEKIVKSRVRLKEMTINN